MVVRLACAQGVVAFVSKLDSVLSNELNNELNNVGLLSRCCVTRTVRYGSVEVMHLIHACVMFDVNEDKK